MSILHFFEVLIVIVLVGWGLTWVNRNVDMDRVIRGILNIVVIGTLIYFLLYEFGLLGPLERSHL